MIRRCLLLSALLIGAACSSNNRTYGGPLTVPASTTTTDAVTTTERVTTSSSSTTSTTTTIPFPTTTTLLLNTTGGVIKVANATEIDEAAQRLTDEFVALGFTVAEPTNGAGKDEDLAVSKIYVVPGAEAIAASVSYLMGGIETLRMPTPAWIFGGTAALGETTVLVMLGNDLATTPLHVMRLEPGRQGPD